MRDDLCLNLESANRDSDAVMAIFRITLGARAIFTCGVLVEGKHVRPAATLWHAHRILERSVCLPDRHPVSAWAGVRASCSRKSFRDCTELSVLRFE